MQAIDAVRAPNGSIVCRSTLTNPTDGCVPYNVFGTGVNSAAQIAYVTGNPNQHSVFKQNVISLNIAGEPFSIWAGGVGNRRKIDRAVTLFPQPLSPTMASVLPFSTEKLTPFTAWIVRALVNSPPPT